MIGGKQQAPLININGTSADELLAQIINAMTAVRKAMQVVTDAAPHGRDYQTASDGSAFRLATNEHRSRLLRLTEISNELDSIGQQICEQRDKLKDGVNNIRVHNLEAAPLVHEPPGGGNAVDD